MDLMKEFVHRCLIKFNIREWVPGFEKGNISRASQDHIELLIHSGSIPGSKGKREQILRIARSLSRVIPYLKDHRNPRELFVSDEIAGWSLGQPAQPTDLIRFSARADGQHGTLIRVETSVKILHPINDGSYLLQYSMRASVILGTPGTNRLATAAPRNPSAPQNPSQPTASVVQSSAPSTHIPVQSTSAPRMPLTPPPAARPTAPAPAVRPTVGHSSSAPAHPAASSSTNNPDPAQRAALEPRARPPKRQAGAPDNQPSPKIAAVPQLTAPTLTPLTTSPPTPLTPHKFTMVKVKNQEALNLRMASINVRATTPVRTSMPFTGCNAFCCFTFTVHGDEDAKKVVQLIDDRWPRLLKAGRMRTGTIWHELDATALIKAALVATYNVENGITSFISMNRAINWKELVRDALKCPRTMGILNNNLTKNAKNLLKDIERWARSN